MVNDKSSKDYPGFIKYHSEHGHLIDSLNFDADQMFLANALPNEPINVSDPREFVMDALVKNARNSRSAIHRSTALAYWSTIRPGWKTDVLFKDKDKIAHAELDLLGVIEEEFLGKDTQDLLVPAWGNMYWEDLMNPTQLQWFKSDPAKDMKFMLLPYHDFHSATAKINDSFVISLDVSIESTLTLINSFMLHAQNQVRKGRDFPIRLALDIFNTLFRQFVEPVPVRDLPLFPCLPLEYYFEMQELSKLQIQFLMSHEFGHVVLGHNSKESTKYFDAKIEEGFSIKALSRSHEAEFEADIFAMGFLRDQKINHLFSEFRMNKVSLHSKSRVSEKKNHVDQEFDIEKQVNELKSIRFAVELLFIYHDMFEAVLLPYTDVKRNRESHPQASDRMGNLRRLFPAGFHRAGEFVFVAQTVAKMFKEYVNAQPPLRNVRELASEMKELIDDKAD